MIYTATRELFCGDGSDDPIAYEIRYSFTVTPGCAATRTQPEEDATADIKKIEIMLEGKWVKADQIADIALSVFGDWTDLEPWLIAEANEAEAGYDDDAADHERDMKMEDRESYNLRVHGLREEYVP